ncbi:MAG: helix-turn-helix domain-containing protein [Chthoniobacterales bacterium]
MHLCIYGVHMSTVDWKRLRAALRDHIDATKTRQIAVSRELGIDQGYVSKLLSGRYSPKRATPKMEALCRIAGLQLNDFIVSEAAPRNAKALLIAAAKICRGEPRKEKALEQLLRVLEKFENNV